MQTAKSREASGAVWGGLPPPTGRPWNSKREIRGLYMRPRAKKGSCWLRGMGRDDKVGSWNLVGCRSASNSRMAACAMMRMVL